MQHSIIDLLFLGEVILMIFFISREPCTVSGCPCLIPGGYETEQRAFPVCCLRTPCSVAAFSIEKDEQTMLREMKQLHGSTIHALDGEIGSVDEILFDDAHWTVRYLIVKTGSWLSERKVLISPMSFGKVEQGWHTIHVNLTREQIKNSPDVDTDMPVSRQWETNYFDYYVYPYYWGGMGGMGMSGWGTYWYPGMLLAQPLGNAQTPEQIAEHQAQTHNDAHLRSTKEVTGYGISATDGHIGHVSDFIVDDETWKICYVAVDTRDWWPGKKVLIPPDWIVEVNWPDNRVTLNLTRDQIQNAPEWNVHDPISRTFENALDAYYAGKRYLSRG